MSQKSKSQLCSLFGFVIYLQAGGRERERECGQHFSASSLLPQHLSWFKADVWGGEEWGLQWDNILTIYPGNLGEIETLTFAVWTGDSLVVAGEDELQID